MALIFTATQCQSCHGLHDLYVEETREEPFSAAAVYSYTCPTTKETATIRPMIAGHSGRPPTDATKMTRKT